MVFNSEYEKQLVKAVRETFTSVDTKELVNAICCNPDFMPDRSAERIKKKYLSSSKDTDYDLNGDLLDDLKKRDGWFEEVIKCLNSDNCRQPYLATEMLQKKEELDNNWKSTSSLGNGNLQESSSLSCKKPRLSQVKTNSPSVLNKDKEEKKSSISSRKKLLNKTPTSKNSKGKGKNFIKKSESSPLTLRKRKYDKIGMGNIQNSRNVTITGFTAISMAPGSILVKTNSPPVMNKGKEKKKSSSSSRKKLLNKTPTSKNSKGKGKNVIKKSESASTNLRKRNCDKVKTNSPSVLNKDKGKKKSSSSSRKSHCPCGNCFFTKKNKLCCYSIMKDVCKKYPKESSTTCISKWKFIQRKITNEKYHQNHYLVYKFDSPPNTNRASFKLACNICVQHLYGKRQTDGDIPCCILHEIGKKFPCS